ncbi:MAG: hypothetical protein WD749_02950, partial [Phycisphaerales bacterium]
VRRLGGWALVVVVIQFTLGWAAFLMLADPVGGRKALAAEVSVAGALTRTAHQANGALLLAVAMGLYLWARRLLRVSRGV